MLNKKRIQGLLTFAILSLICLLFPQKTWAAPKDNFHTTLKSTYTVNTNGTTFVEHSLAIKNLTPEFFISKYGLTVNSTQLDQIKVISNNRELTPSISKPNAHTEISIEFPDKLVGQDKIRHISISYQNPDLAQINGKVLEVNIPRLANPEHYDARTAVLVTPVQFGVPHRVTPGKYQYQQTGNNLTIEFKSLHDQGISAIFGDMQIFDLTLRYHLDNPNNQTAVTQVSLPPDTGHQKMLYHQLEPLPESVEADFDGNWIATYVLPPNKTTEVNVQASALITAEDIHPDLHPAPAEVHTRSQKFWPVNSSEIQKIASSHQTPEEIYHYTVNTLNYTDRELKNGANRIGAKNILDNPNDATCQEFADLFVTLVRANGIPARRITGYAYSENSKLRPLSMITDILHTWPEYYDQENQEWVAVDPTWGDTTGGVDYFNQFDLNHVAFAINGKSSELPYPAGAYKLENKETKDVEVKFRKDLEFVSPHFELEVDPVKLFSLISLPGYYQLKLTNKTGQAWYGLNLNVINSKQDLKTTLSASDFSLLPYQQKSFKLNLYNRSKWLPKNKSIKLNLKIPGNKKLDLAAIEQGYEFELLAIGPVSRFEKAINQIGQQIEKAAKSVENQLVKFRQ